MVKIFFKSHRDEVDMCWVQIYKEAFFTFWAGLI